jgi:small subunit ribosomal protein S20
MPQHKSAEKRIKVFAKKAKRNSHYVSTMRTQIKKVKTAGNKETAQSELKKTIVLLDQLARKGIIHSNNAANHKSRLIKFVASMK